MISYQRNTNLIELNLVDFLYSMTTSGISVPVSFHVFNEETFIVLI